MTVMLEVFELETEAADVLDLCRKSAWSYDENDAHAITDLLDGAGLPNDVKVTIISGRMV